MGQPSLFSLFRAENTLEPLFICFLSISFPFFHSPLLIPETPLWPSSFLCTKFRTTGFLLDLRRTWEGLTYRPFPFLGSLTHPVTASLSTFFFPTFFFLLSFESSCPSFRVRFFMDWTQTEWTHEKNGLMSQSLSHISSWNERSWGREEKNEWL